VSAILCGLVGSLPILTAILALSADPLLLGVNFTAIVQLECAGTVPPPHVPPVTAKSPAFAPPILPSLTDSKNPDKLVTVIFLVFDFVVSVPNASVLAGDTVAGIVGPVLIATICGLDESGLSAIESVADSVPSTPGLNFT
jgi:hypothetical protein